MKISDALSSVNVDELIERYEFDYNYIGVRIQEPEFELGQIAHNSHHWEDNIDFGTELDGICSIDLMSGYFDIIYPGFHAAIICGNMAERGNDYGEIIIEDAVVVEILA